MSELMFARREQRISTSGKTFSARGRKISMSEWNLSTCRNGLFGIARGASDAERTFPHVEEMFLRVEMILSRLATCIAGHERHDSCVEKTCSRANRPVSVWKSHFCMWKAIFVM